MMDLGVEFGVTSLPSLVGFGGRRAERVTERLGDVKKLSDQRWMSGWVDEVMEKGDPFAVGGGNAGGGLFGKMFG